MSKLKSSPDEPKRRLSKWWILLAVILAGVGFRVAHEVQLIRQTPVTSWSQDASADCAIVLTGGPARVREGFDLLAEKKVKKLIISGVNPDVKVRELLPPWIFYGLNEDDVVLEKRSETTWGNAQQSLPIVEALHCRDVLLVTSRIHMRRALRTFRAVFPENVDIQTQTVAGHRMNPGFFEVLNEAGKSLFYSVWAY